MFVYLFKQKIRKPKKKPKRFRIVTDDKNMVRLTSIALCVCLCVRLCVQAEMERALLQGERQAELSQIETETDIITQLQHKVSELESAIQREKDKVRTLSHTRLRTFHLLKTQNPEKPQNLCLKTHTWILIR